MQHHGYGRAGHVQPPRQVTLGNAVMAAYDPQAPSLARVDTLVGHHLEHELPMKAHRPEEGVKDPQGGWIYPADLGKRRAFAFVVMHCQTSSTAALGLQPAMALLAC